MPARDRAIRLTPGDMDLMAMLWARGPLTLAEAHAAFPGFGRAIGYPTMQTRLNRLVEKGAVTRTTERPSRYAAATTREQLSTGHLRQLFDRFGSGHLVPLVAALISERPLTEAELAELKRLLTDAEQRQGDKKHAERRGRR